MEQSISSTDEFRYLHRVIRVYVSLISAQPKQQLLQRHLPLRECEMLQRINLKTLPMRNAGLFDDVYSYIKNKNRESA
ncbi:MAG: hypothetical protein SGI87_06760 [Flavobacteriales bacterium]|nr:hypothetical protein [Flavobacteriales bacterium]